MQIRAGTVVVPRGRRSTFEYAYRVTIQMTILDMHRHSHSHSHGNSAIFNITNMHSQSFHQYARLDNMHSHATPSIRTSKMFTFYLLGDSYQVMTSDQ